MKYNKIIGLILSSIIVSCGSNSNSDSKSESKEVSLKSDTLEEYAPLTDRARVSRLMDSIYSFGDTNAYSSLSSDYFISSRLDEFLYYALIMANKYNYSKAYFDVYYTLSHPYSGEEFQELDDRTKRMALYYLLKAYELGDSQASHEAHEIYKDKLIPNSLTYRNIE